MRSINDIPIHVLSPDQMLTGQAEAVLSEITDLGQFVLHHEQADIAVDALGLAAGHEAVDAFDLHGNG